MFGFGWGNFNPFAESTKKPATCKDCDLYHGKKFEGFICKCDCHEKIQQSTSDLNKAQDALEWDADEEITKPMGTVTTD